MPNGIGPTGLTTASQDELVTNFTTAFQTIYGPDINLDASTPDGQMMMIFIQSILDALDLVRQVNAQFDPDQAVGTLLDQRVSINGIQRQAGTYTITNITLVVSQALSLPGLDQTLVPAYTVADNAGNNWKLMYSQNIAVPGTYVYAFQAEYPGAVLTTPNSISVPVSVVLGVVSINNPTTYTALGINEESDAALRIRRQKSVALSSQGYLKGLLAALQNINGVTDAFVYENNTNATNGDGVPSHSIWVITQGGDDASIAQAIYSKRNAGCGMYGSKSYVITQLDGTPFIVNWDQVTPQNLYIKFTVTSLDGVNAPNVAAIKAGLVNSFVPAIFSKVNVNDLATDVQEIDSNTLVTNAGFSTSPSGTYTNVLTPTSKNMQFAVSQANIIILPMGLSPSSLLIGSGGATRSFSAIGGYGTKTYTMQSGSGTIHSVTGLYTSGSVGTDVVLVTDALGNTATAVVTVV